MEQQATNNLSIRQVTLRTDRTLLNRFFIEKQPLFCVEHEGSVQRLLQSQLRALLKIYHRTAKTLD